MTKGRIVDLTHPIVDRVTAAGAVVHAGSTTPEYSATVVTNSKLWGITRSPWSTT